MIDSSRFFERLLQSYRFRKAKPHLIGDVMDFGGNKGELKKFCKGRYLVVNYDHSVMENAHYDTIVCLAVIEHIAYDDVFDLFHIFRKVLNKEGRIFLTTPTIKAKPVLEFMAQLGIIDQANIAEHQHYWSKRDIYELADKTRFTVKEYKKFQIGFNQMAVLIHKH